VPKGFFPVQDTGVIQGITEATQSISFAAMGERSSAGRGGAARPGGGKPVVLHRRGWHQRHAQQRRMLINLKPQGATPPPVIRRLPQAPQEVPGMTLYMQPVQDLTIEDRVRAPSTSSR
jgi:multidrug efflux pump